MSLRLHDTAARAVRDFTPVTPGVVTVYLCGATVQAPPHIGHIRSGISFDILRRWLEVRGYDVVFCRNVTDIDDKILARAAAEGIPWWRMAARNEQAFSTAYDVLGCLPPTVAPRATGHVPEMITMMRTLIDAGHAYAAGGDVYFDVRSWPDYGALSGQRLEHLQPAGDTADDARKRDPRDFALWKAAKPGEPTWETPWGPGRPGWHLECSAMARRYLGAEFDIHGGGHDLVFPHHENEIAQSRAAGDGFARYWLHNGLVTLSGDKMSKSLGNSLLVSEVVRRVRPVALRYYLAAAHYRSGIDYSEAALEEAAGAYERIEGFVRRAGELVGEVPVAAEVPPDFAAAMNDDLAVPAALALVHGAVREGNTGLAGGDKETVSRVLSDLRAMLDVLGLDPLAEPWTSAAAHAAAATVGPGGVVAALVSVALSARDAARERKDYTGADAIRDQLTTAGVVVEDTPDGPRWTLRTSR